ncbi:conserved hypothetical protein [Methanocella paludicola SANAE]|uniref:DUF1622 domain-containing protein n=2 Tax=Methanocella TaxID=570266 RepID=D1Z150_METPS|nr:conserved hypothetical protein [Methanocella paludicola SANAE]
MGDVVGCPMTGIENYTMIAVDWLKSATEMISVILVATGVVVTSFKILQMISSPHLRNYNQARLTFSRYLVMALEFMLAADIVATAVKPSWNDLIMLGSIAIIRTFLNFFLQREMKEEEEAIKKVA